MKQGLPLTLVPRPNFFLSPSLKLEWSSSTAAHVLGVLKFELEGIHRSAPCMPPPPRAQCPLPHRAAHSPNLAVISGRTPRPAGLGPLAACAAGGMGLQV